MQIRNVESKDYSKIIPVVNDWWDGRQMAEMLPKLFFDHFQETGFVVERDHEIVGFLIGFVSQTHPNVGYIHFVGIHPDHRKQGVAHRLYQRFYQAAKQKGCGTVRCVTSPVNKRSIAYHTKIGFDIETGDGEVNGIPVKVNYDGLGQDRVLFVKNI